MSTNCFYFHSITTAACVVMASVLNIPFIYSLSCCRSCSMFSPSKLRQHNSVPNSPCALRSRSHHTHHHTSCGRGKLVEVPLWFHGLMERKVAEELLLKSPFRGHTGHPSSREGLFLVRQSSNRGGKITQIIFILHDLQYMYTICAHVQMNIILL